MTPTSPLAGVLTGLIDGAVIALLVLLVVQVLARRHRTAPVRAQAVTRAVTPDATHPPAAGDLPRAA